MDMDMDFPVYTYNIMDAYAMHRLENHSMHLYVQRTILHILYLYICEYIKTYKWYDLLAANYMHAHMDNNKYMREMEKTNARECAKYNLYKFKYIRN